MHLRCQSISTPLSHQSKEGANQNPTPHTRRPQQVQPANTRGLLLQLQRLLNLDILRFHKLGSFVSFGVILDKYRARFVSATFGDEPPWRFGEEEYESDLEAARDYLQEGWDSPAPVARHLEGA
jgi:hypothetical protein